MNVCDLTHNTSPPIGYWTADWRHAGECNYDDIDEVLWVHRPTLTISLRNFHALNEATYKQIAAAIDPNFLHQGIRARSLRGVYYQGFFWPNTAGAAQMDRDTMWFKVTSSLHQWNGLDYDCFVKFLNWDEIANDPDMTQREKALMMLWTSDIQLDCNDLSFRYWGYQYILTQIDAAIRPEQRPPVKRNPHHRGVVCKHLNRVLKALPFHNGDITREIVNQFGGKVDQQSIDDIEKTNQLSIQANQGMGTPPEIQYPENSTEPVPWATQQDRIDLVKQQTPPEDETQPPATPPTTPLTPP